MRFLVSQSETRPLRGLPDKLPTALFMESGSLSGRVPDLSRTPQAGDQAEPSVTLPSQNEVEKGSCLELSDFGSSFAEQALLL